MIETNDKDYSPTPKEKYVEFFLEDKSYKFKRQVKLSNLKNDHKSHRVADYYLVDFDVYLEYFGMWHQSEKDKNNINEKINVYLKNGKPTIFIYPEELGYLDWAFHYKLLTLLGKTRFEKTHGKLLRKYRRKSFLRDSLPDIVWAIIFIIIAISILIIPDYFLIIIFVLFFTLGVNNFIQLYKEYKVHQNDYGVKFKK
ncbi:MAG: hypothetical protein OEW67_01840 [Cyclobacteriaceae bacterium]|nr:hypothetical protein [Cyclobacteriaceae bacterium]